MSNEKMSVATISIKPVAPGDVADLSAIALQAYRGHYLHLWYDSGEWYMKASFSTEKLSAELTDANARFFIVDTNESRVGFFKVNIDAPLDEEKNALELERIYFVKEAGGSGIGTAAVEYVFQMAAALGKNIVWLKVMDSSAAAIAFYKKRGFEICGTYQLDIPMMKEELRGMYIMKKHLKQS